MTATIPPRTATATLRRYALQEMVIPSSVRR